ncbi:T9SS type A sorting domain-containing protein [bacterium SCSIO 12741]|nr:T9SS type A sorting domain-containing protein [bacterium SCSIO 12741]
MTTRKSPLLLTLLLVVFASSLRAQTFDYQWSHSTPVFPGGITSKDSNHMYFAGTFIGTKDLDFSPTTLMLTQHPTYSGGFFGKYDTNRKAVWVKSITYIKPVGGFIDGMINESVHLDANNNLYIAGGMGGLFDFDPGTGVDTLRSSSLGFASQYVASYDSVGNYRWAFKTDARDIHMVVDDSGYVYVVGHFDGTVDFEPGTGITSLTSQSASDDVYVARYKPNGSLDWVKQIGGADDEYGRRISFHKQGILIGLEFKGTVDFNPGSGVNNAVSSGDFDLAVVKLKKNGDFQWVKSVGGSLKEYCNGLGSYGSGQIYMSGTFAGTADFDPSSNQANRVSNGSRDVFLLQLDSSGNFLDVLSVGSSGNEEAHWMTLDDTGNVMVTGYLRGTADFDPDTAVKNVTGSNVGDYAFVAMYDSQLDLIDAYSYKIGSGYVVRADYHNEGFTASGDNTLNFDADPGPGVASIVSAGNESYYIHYSVTPAPKPVVSVNDTTHLCNGGSVLFRGQQVSIAGSYRDTVVGATVDSLFHLLLTTGSPSQSNVTIHACDSFTSPSGKFTWMSSGNYQDTLVNSSGCDSVLSIQLVLHYTVFTTDSITACDTYTWGGKSYQSSNYTAVDTLQSVGGCDSIVSLALTILNRSGAALSVTACNEYTSPSGNYTWSNSGTYLDTIVNHVGCDSIISVALTLVGSSSSTDSVIACDRYTSPSGKYTWKASGTYQDTLTNKAGCDSLLSIVLQINKSVSTHDTVRACYSYTTSSGKVWSNSGIYLDTLSASTGCDSSVTYVVTIDTVAYLFGYKDPHTLFARSKGATLKWLDCDNNYSVVSGATDSIFSPGRVGSFAAQVTQHGCIDTTECKYMDPSSVQDAVGGKKVRIFPNPTVGQVHLSLPKGEETVAIELLTLQGVRLEYWDSYRAEDPLDFNHFKAGTYFIRIFSQGGRLLHQERIIKQ